MTDEELVETCLSDKINDLDRVYYAAGYGAYVTIKELVECIFTKAIPIVRKAVAEETKTLKLTHKKSKKEGITLFAWWKDGVQYVGTCGTTLEKALKEIDDEQD